MTNRFRITVVIPYHNESKTIIKTLKQLVLQSYKKFDVILVNSQSSDNSSALIDNFIKKNNLKKKFQNINKRTFFPSSSKNVGIKLSKNNWIAFMDCDLIFKNNWLKSQIDFINKNKVKFVLGTCNFRGYGILDSCFVAQTWGFDNKVPVIPSSLFHKSIFKKIGLFENKRAGYDRFWKIRLKNYFNNNLNINNKCIIKYNKYNHASNIISFIKKIYNYSYSSSTIKQNSQPKKYMIFFIILISLAIYNLNFFMYFILFYFIFRSYLYPIIKSKNIKFFKLGLLTLFLMPIVGILIDITRIFAFSKIFFKIN